MILNVPFFFVKNANLTFTVKILSYILLKYRSITTLFLVMFYVCLFVFLLKYCLFITNISSPGQKSNELLE